MRNWIITTFFLYREFKIFGKTISRLRAATPTVIAFFFGVISQTIIGSEHWLVLLIEWIPFIICIFLGFYYYKYKPVKYDELIDWQQQLKYLKKPDQIGTKDETFPDGFYYMSELKRLNKIHFNYFSKNNVDVIKGLAPTLVTILGAIIFVLLQ
jgi:hypothetical protein